MKYFFLVLIINSREINKRSIKNSEVASEFEIKGTVKQLEVITKLESLLSRIKASADDPNQVINYLGTGKLNRLFTRGKN